MVDFRDLIADMLKLDLVKRAITCPITQEVLDVRTCVVVLDADELPTVVVSPAGYRKMVAIAADLGNEPLKPPYHFDPKTIPAEPEKEQTND